MESINGHIDKQTNKISVTEIIGIMAFKVKTDRQN